MSPARRLRGFASALAGLLTLTSLVERTGHADGAFPDSRQILLPADRPHEIQLTTNFGLLVSRDDGATWHLLCEEAITSGIVGQIQLGPAPGNVLFASGRGLHVSEDDGCHFVQSGGTIAELTPSDVWPDPIDPRRVFAIGYSAGPGGTYTSSVFPSLDGGHSFGAPLLAAAGTDFYASVESARTGAAMAPRALYVTAFSPSTRHPTLLRSSDGGAHFTVVDHSATVGDATLRIAAVDPADPRRLYLRVEGAAVDSLALSDDGGDTLRIALTLADRMTTLLRRADGTVLVASADGKAWRSANGNSDGGSGFVEWLGVPHIRGLAERDDRLYAATDHLRDGFAVAVTDDGVTWKPLLRFSDICGPLDCVAPACAAGWQVLVATLKINPVPACFTRPMDPPAPTDDAAPSTDAAHAPIADLTVAGMKESGCSCALGRHSPNRGDHRLPLLLLLLGAPRFRHRRARRRAMLAS